MSIRPEIPDVQGVKDEATTKILRAVKSAFDSVTGRSQQKIKTLGSNANFFGTVKKVNEIINRIQGDPSLDLGAVTTIPGQGGAITGTGKMVLDTSPTLITPALGTPASGVLTKVTGLPNAGTSFTWTTPAYSSGDFTSSSGTWVVEAGDVATYIYVILGKLMIVLWYLNTTTITGTPTLIKIAVPAGKTIAKASKGMATKTTGGVGSAAGWYVTATEQVINLTATEDMGATAWAAGTDTIYVAGSAIFEIQ